ncbi:PAS domain S-box protein [Haloarchaeobius amylolyticus]|uniref:PAS domain S-box protein n=1 Tax=Haloarchaeobius amylolyticus TaxID=1198296 RepID=A0ABD6BJQ1_9EURY
MLVPPAAGIQPAVRRRLTAITVLVIDQEDDRDHVERAFDDEAVVETAATLADARPRFDEVDCLVVPSTMAIEDSGVTGGNVAATDGAGECEWLETIRTERAELPIVVLADEATATLTRAVRSYEWTTVITRTEPRDRLATRVTDLLERHRLALLSRRSLASVELAGDAIAIVDSTGAIQFASRSFTMRFGADGDELTGTPWRELFTDDAVAHLESVAVPTVAEGWRWTGTCTGRRRTGATFPVRIRLGGLSDGSLVFVVSEVTHSRDEREE